MAVLKQYADYQWAVDDDFYVIFEHLGTNQEETEWVNYKLSQGKGIMMWSKLTDPYNEATMGYNENRKSDFSWIDYKNRGWSVPANVAYMESHDEERLMFKNLEFGNADGSYNVKDKATALERQKTAGAFYFMVPGPKMIWQFGELGYDVSINDPCRVCNKPIRWEYFEDPDRKALYELWAKLVKLKLQEPIFQSSEFSVDADQSSGLKKIQLTDTEAGAELQHINVIGNFGVVSQQIDPDFQATGTWYDLLDDNRSLNVTNVNAPITLAPGEFRIYGSSQVVLPVDEFELMNADLLIYPNPVTERFRINKPVQKLEIYDYTGRLVSRLEGDFFPDQEYDASWLKPSIYILRISTELGSTSRRLIVE